MSLIASEPSYIEVAKFRKAWERVCCGTQEKQMSNREGEAAAKTTAESGVLGFLSHVRRR